METIFILTACVLPALLYMALGIFIYKRIRSSEENFLPKELKDYSILFLVISGCFLLGCVHVFKDGTDLQLLADYSVIKLYLLSSLMPCAVVRRNLYNESKSRKIFYVPLSILLFLIFVTDVLSILDVGAIPYSILFRGAVLLMLCVFSYNMYTSIAHGKQMLRDGRSSLGSELRFHMILISVSNYFFLMYSFGIHPVWDYFLMLSCYLCLQVAVVVMALRRKPLASLIIVRGNREDAERKYPMRDLIDSPEDWNGHDRDVRLKDSGEGSALSLKERLVGYFESEKPYLSKTLSMEEVSMRLFTNKSYLSKTINMEMNKNFREFVNSYRVKEAMRIFSSNPDISMNELRDRSGFNNNASFTSAFKLNTGSTPGEWCRDIKNKASDEGKRR